ncbi:polysaccharide deacetylase family protein [Algisphaera agarilytica]|uniref:Peptidoglycan/xylan/chitin deacetylase (PgdA/CDA1 family) n=1 Tax=Algisphaera agarilytica TaxID=1385975 RepID=A0A7X0HBK4_9BACT|nr:polysaccharide deacetylase family protein [Algisphaera agarilytica]MBB6431706.1 peptidoglycan/xylan/chitin deacetylase (PgdA/CDA1 family) [Algisphaera agarilytica]
MRKTTQVSFIFDDGFEQSCLRVAELFETRGLHATFAVMAKPEGFLDEFPKGDFELWNQFQARGHGIHPHGLDHSDLAAIPYSEATAKIDECLAYFAEHLDGFSAADTPYHLTYNRSTPEVEQYLLQRVAAIRTCGDGQPTDGLNDDQAIDRRSFTSAWHGPEPCDDHLLATLKNAEDSDAPLLLYMLHGLDQEGWGPISDNGLQRALDFIQASKTLDYRPLDALLPKRSPS